MDDGPHSCTRVGVLYLRHIVFLLQLSMKMNVKCIYMPWVLISSLCDAIDLVVAL